MIPSRVPWALLLLASSLAVAPRGMASDKPRHVRYDDVRPILAANCFKCHGPDEETREAGLRLDTDEGIRAELEGGVRAVIPGDVEGSELVARVTSEDPDVRMPPTGAGRRLTEGEVNLIKEWIAQGAVWSGHWSFFPPRRPSLPEVRDGGWSRNAVDRFILARLDALGLSPAPEADRYTLIRRVSLDLTGLPPTWEEAEQFASDSDPAAYERLVDNLLDSPAFGERWGKVWLDLARYADSAGYANDPERTIWRYRDWVIDAINKNMPFDQFTIEQLAGDLLPNASQDQILATAFHRNTLTNSEGGTDDEEFRTVAVVDRVNTTMEVWMGMTMGCAQCHSHKYDPITQVEYYRFFAFFNNTEDSDRADEAPAIPIPTDLQREAMAALRAALDALREVGVGEDDERYKVVKEQLDAIKPPLTPIMKELPEERRRKTHVLVRGNFLNKDEEVTPGTPAAFHPLLQHGVSDQPDRLALARWLVDEQNPLTGRVTANRFWEKVFGQGLVTTSEDFGTQGEPPSHPELLDWLATELVEENWDVKRFLRLLVTSAAYRQSSKVTQESAAVDPENRWLSRGPRFRPDAETLRDQALACAGLLSRTVGGASVRPPRPYLGVTAAFGGTTDWEPSAGGDRYRRGIYTSWRRTMPYPSMAIFDAPTREVCTIRRGRTNTPLQALVTMNDPAFVECAQALARRITMAGTASSGDPSALAALALRWVLARPPADAEIERLVRLYHEARDEYQLRPDDALAMACDPIGPPPEGADVVELAAWTVVGNVLFNLDETLSRR